MILGNPLCKVHIGNVHKQLKQGQYAIYGQKGGHPTTQNACHFTLVDDIILQPQQESQLLEATYKMMKNIHFSNLKWVQRPRTSTNHYVSSRNMRAKSLILILIILLLCSSLHRNNNKPRKNIHFSNIKWTKD
jgi:hypothetical protein